LSGDALPDDQDPEEYIYNKRNSIDHLFMQVYEELSQPPYSLHFYLSFSKELIRHAEKVQDIDQCLEILRQTQKCISPLDIELFLFYNPDVAIQIVNDLIDEPNNKLNS
jgi:hypothetical protein